MTTKPKAIRYNIRRIDRPVAPPEASEGDRLFDNHDDGFGNLDFRRPEAAAPQLAPDPTPAERPPAAAARPAASDPEEARIEAALAEIAAEGISERMLRRARLIAQKLNFSARSDLDAVRLLREAGVNPFSRVALVNSLPTPTESPAPAAEAPPVEQREPRREEPPPPGGRELARLPGDTAQLPQRTKPMKLPSTEQRADVNQAAEIRRMQKDIAKRRRRRLALLCARLAAFVLLPAFLAGWYFYQIATPMYAVRTEFVIQQAGPQQGGGGVGGLLSGTSLATSQDSIAVQGYLQSREAMGRLDADLDFRAHFQDPGIDTLQRLDQNSTLESAYRAYRKYVKISYDQTEGIIRMDVAAADPQLAAKWSEQLVNYAEEQVDHLTQRLRADHMRDAEAGYESAKAELAASQRKLIELQENFKIVSSETEIGMISGQIATLESQLTEERLSLAQMESNPEPNQARMEPVKRRIATLSQEIADLRGRMTESTSTGSSLAQIQGELLVAQADLQTRQLLLAQALQSVETSRVEAGRQVRYLSLSVRPIPPDEPTYPRAFENTLAALLILLGIYLMVSMTAAILREQVSS